MAPEGKRRLPAVIPQACFPVVLEHVEKAAAPLYWAVVDDAWNITAASGSFQEAILEERPLPVPRFLDCLGPGFAENLCQRAAEGDLDRRSVEVVHPVRSGTRLVLYHFRKLEGAGGWMLFGRDRSEQIELVSQMSVLIEDLDLEMQKERALGERLRTLLANDHLTGLTNRRRLEEILEERWEAFVAAKKQFAVIALDVDHFKAINDSFGHDVGDGVLKRVSEAIVASVRSTDTACRQGGDEFLVIVSPGSIEEAVKIGERIRRRIHLSPMPCGSRRISVSVGVAATDRGSPASVAELLKWGDAALLRAKQLGRNCVLAHPETESG
jgi:diguanylate cyclase (GGDEF)-like protein